MMIICRFIAKYIPPCPHCCIVISYSVIIQILNIAPLRRKLKSHNLECRLHSTLAVICSNLSEFLFLLLLQGEVTHLGNAERKMNEDLEQLKDQLTQQREHRRQQERRVGHTPLPHFQSLINCKIYNYSIIAFE